MSPLPNIVSSKTSVPVDHGSQGPVDKSNQPDDRVPHPARDLKNRTLDERFKIKPETMFERLFEKAQYVFVGEVHPVQEEIIFIDMVEGLKNSGVENITVEYPKDSQDDLVAYLSGQNPTFSKDGIPLHTIYPEQMKFLKKAHEAGIKIVCFDRPHTTEAKQMSRIERENFLASELINLSGKTLVLTGGAHIPIDFVPFATVRTQLIEAGKETAGVQFESYNGVLIMSGRNETLPFMFSAFRFFFPEGGVAKSFAYPTTQLDGLKFLDPTPIMDSNGYSDFYAKESWLDYSVAYDYVLFLSDEDSPPVLPPRQ